MELKKLKELRKLKDDSYAVVFFCTTGLFCGEAFVLNSFNSLNYLNYLNIIR